MKTTKAHAAVEARRGSDASQILTVEIFNDGILQTTASVADDGSWSATLSGLRLGAQSLSAKSESVTSETYGFSIIEATQPLYLDPSPVTLQTMLYVLTQDNVPPAFPPFPPGSTISRIASGGKPPYSYTSSNPKVADVTSAGLVSPRGNGSAMITVMDNAGQSKSYTVTVSSVWTAEHIGAFIHNGALEYQRPGGHLPDPAELRRIGDQFRWHWPEGISYGWYWSSECAPGVIKQCWGHNFGNEAEQLFLGALILETFSVYPRNA